MFFVFGPLWFVITVTVIYYAFQAYKLQNANGSSSPANVQPRQYTPAEIAERNIRYAAYQEYNSKENREKRELARYEAGIFGKTMRFLSK